MYESGTQILCSAAAPTPDKLFRTDDKFDAVMAIEHDNGPPLALKDPAAQIIEYQHGKLASVLELDFAFQRAASRLSQMVGQRQRAVTPLLENPQ